ncbi:nitroreductase [Anaerococcus sp. AGMB00486]|uniref:Nitroreductase n=1 Tax=Anaerococcus faecalis TaxID=2742993 RepID=A0ABX2N704_9FIRM|nr:MULTISPECIES: nitroreductase family protein [Anaerococcus]MDY3007123.1 nitroreductase family protein [Anaerococcus porci]NVF10477.1 nitroreductase [Anaerococcus faecalis]
MLTTNFLKTRTSTREFKESKVEESKIEKIYEYVTDIKAGLYEEDLSFEISKDGEGLYEKLNGKAGYKGVMIKAPIYVGLDVKNHNQKALVKGAYGLEELITKLSEIGLASCWISVVDASEDDLNSAFLDSKGNIKSILAVGEALNEEVREHRFDDRKGINEFVFIDDLNHKASVEEIEQRGMDDLFSYLRFAPSSYNSQPWRFVLVDNLVKLYLEDYKDESNLVDAGIVMYYFDQLTKDLSINSSWDVKPNLDGSKQVFIAQKEL